MGLIAWNVILNVYRAQFYRPNVYNALGILETTMLLYVIVKMAIIASHLKRIV